ncbi:MAG: M42 family metallopeptidase [Bacillota bacterium]
MAPDTRLLRELSEADGVPAFEHEVRTILRAHMEPLGTIEHDRLGSIIVKKRGSADRPSVMLAAHMDEVGLIVRSITDKGFLRFQPLGGWWDPVIVAQPVVVKTRAGGVPGVIGSKPPHILTEEERKKFPEKKEMFIDVGASSSEDAKAMGIMPGDPIVVKGSFVSMAGGNLLMGKAWDDRVGCAAMVEAIRALKDVDHPNTVYAAGTVQEEVGLRGARTSAWVIKPDVCLALEVAIAADTPGLRDFEAGASVSCGPVIFTSDGSMIPNPRLRDLVVRAAEEDRIPYQFDSMAGGGTDAGQIHMSFTGVPSLVLGIPTRYIHSPNSIFSLQDYQHMVDLIVSVVRRLDEGAVASLVP